jgi:hypothetical protein
MAGPTRLELATSGVTGRRSNQLNYDPALNEREQSTEALGGLSTGPETAVGRGDRVRRALDSPFIPLGDPLGRAQFRR